MSLDRHHLAPGAAAFTAAMLVALFGLYASADSPRQAPQPRRVVKLRILGVNDLHGHLEPPQRGLGGVAWLKSHLDRATVPGHTIRVHAGDMVGASPLVSSYFHDEPTIEVANELGFDVGTLGNHEFDQGRDELLRLLRGGRRTGSAASKPDARGRQVNTSSPGFGGASFPYVAANSFHGGGGRMLPPYRIVERAGVRVGFIGVTTPSTPKFLIRRFAERLRFSDISDTVNRWVPELRRRDVEAIVVLAHAGAPAQDASDRATGEIVEETRQMSDAVDVVIAGHSHSRLDLRVPNSSGHGHKLVVEALAYGMAYELVDLSVDRRTGNVVAKSAQIAPTGHVGVSKDPEVAALVDRYAGRVAPLADHVVGDTGAALTRVDGELGQLVADAQRAYTRADVAVVSPVSLRADIDSGSVTYAEVARALAFDHPLLRIEMTGEELRRLLEAIEDATFVSGPERPPDPDATYTVAASELVAIGHSLPALRHRGGRRPAAGTEVEALAWYLER